MHIEELHLLSADLDAQESFYGTILGLSTERRSEGTLEVQTGENLLVFHEGRAKEQFYHFCFLIPTGSLESAIDFAKGVGLEILLNRGEMITHFDNGRSIYFHDGDENIAEFIERPLVDYPSQRSFGISDLIKTNEIGLLSPDPESVANDICDNYGIVPLAPENFDDVFCWAGDHEGVIIVVKEGRGWLPTGRPGISSPFLVRYREDATSYTYRHDWSFE